MKMNKKMNKKRTNIIFKRIMAGMVTVAIIIFTVLSIILLGGCGVYKSDFDCKPKKGVGCESVSKVNELLDSNLLDDFIEGKSRYKACKDCPELIPYKKEKMIIHFNERKDESGNIHLPHDIHVVF